MLLRDLPSLRDRKSGRYGREEGEGEEGGLRTKTEGLALCVMP